MSIPRNLLNSKRERVLLGAELGRGGEGAVFSLDGDATVAAKIYLSGRADERREKILAMVAGRWSERSPNVAFPIDVLFDTSQRFVGFTMRCIDKQKPIHSLYSPTSRKTEFPKANFRFLIRVALNIARCVANVHSTGCVIGDINHSGILVAEDATVTLIDCDSFQVATPSRLFPCKVGVPEFTPPELQGKRLSDIKRSANHDAFGLAVLLFNLLFMGRHPFAGRYAGRDDLSMEKAIAEYRFAYSARKSETLMSPPPHVPTLADIPKKLADAFELSFGPVGTTGQRPTSAEWVTLISEAEKDVVQCTKSSAHQHFSGAKTCPWCAMEKAYPGFLAFSQPLNIDTSAPIDIGQLISAINLVPDPGNVPALREVLPTLVVRAPPKKSLLEGLTREYRWGLLFCVISLQLFFLPSPAPLLGLGLFGLGVWYAFRERGVLDGPNKAKAEIEKAINNIETSWGRVRDNVPFDRIRSESNELIRRFQSLGPEEARRLADLRSRVEEGQRRRFLEKFYIEKAKIKGVGVSGKLKLESYGVETAADVDQSRILQIPGFGPVTTDAILDWRRSVERKFRFDPRLGVDPKDVLTVQSDIARRRAEYQIDLKKRLLLLREQSQRIIQARDQLKAAAEPVWENLNVAEGKILEAKAKLPSKPHKWMFGLIVSAALLILSNLNYSGNSDKKALSSPSKVANANQSVIVATPVSPSGLTSQSPSSGGTNSVSAFPEKPNVQEAPPRVEVQPLAAPIELSNPTIAAVDPAPSLDGVPPRIDDIRDRGTVRWVQTRLQELGFLKGNLSGVFDGATLGALREFKVASSGRMDDNWDRGTQQALSSRAATKYRDSFVGSWSEGAICRNRAEPDIVIGYQSARSSAGGVCQFQSVNVSGTGWDIRTSCSNLGEKWVANIHFRISGDSLFWRGRDGSTTRYTRCSS